MNEKDIPQCDELLMKILVIPETIVDFKKSRIMWVQESKFTGNVFAVEKAKYIGNGLWETISKIKLKGSLKLNKENKK